jgi:MFS family permease
VLVLATSLVHPFGLLIHRPYWIDEAWVAALTRLPFGRALDLSLTTPTGWVALVWMVPGDSSQRGRLVTLAFSMLSAGAAYVFARGLPWNGRGTARVAAIAVAIVVSCVPIAIVRNDLKQYTADAFFALALLAVTRFVDRDSNPRAVVWLGAAALIAVPFSTNAAFVSVACFTGLFATAVVARRRDRVIATLIVGGVAALGFAVVFAATVLPRVSKGLTRYWSDFYLTGGPAHMLGQSWTRLDKLSNLLAMPAWVFFALFVVGIVALVRLHAIAVAIAVPFLWIEMFIAARAHKYPLLDQRTFHFVLIPTVAVIAIGVAWVVVKLARRLPIAGILLAVLAGALFVNGVSPYWRAFGVPNEDVRTQAAYVAQHMRAKDIVVVSRAASYGFAYYWQRDPVSATRASAGLNDFSMEVHNPNVVLAGSGSAAVLAALRQGIRLQQQSGSGSRVFIVLTHLVPAEKALWTDAFRALHVQPRVVKVGAEPLRVIDPTG